MSELKLPAASGGGSISIKGPSSSSSDVDLLDTSGNLNLADDQKIKIGTGDDLQIYHNGSDAFIDKTTTDGRLQIKGDGIQLKSGSNNFIHCDESGVVEITHSGSKKFETGSGGIEVTGGINLTTNLSMLDNGILKIGTGDDLQIKHDGTNNIIHASNGYIQHRASAHYLNDEASSINFIRLENSAAKLCYGGNTKLETISTGINVTGGIRLGGNNAANECDDYEEGTFTPKLGGSSNKSSYNVSGSGFYVKIGKMVHIQVRFHGVDLDNSADGAALIYDMPFTSSSASTNPICAGGVTAAFQTYNIDFNNGNRYTFYISGNTTQWNGLKSRSNDSWVDWDIDDFNVQNVLYIDFSGTYRTT